MSITYTKDVYPYECEKYECSTVEEAKLKLNEYGVAIIKDILNQEECLNMQEGMWSFLETVTSKFPTPINRWDSKTWINMKELYPMHHMLIQHWSVGHAQFMWNLRQNPKILDVFRKLWNEKDLISSFDGCSFNMPPEYTGNGWFKKSWLHSDQNYTRNTDECFQSWVTAFDVNEGDATLCFLENSHKYHKAFQERFNITDKGDWYLLDNKTSSQYEHNFYLNNNCPKKFIKCKAGSMVLWNSKTIHCGVEPIKDRPQANFRCVAYICMTPKKLASETIIKKRIKAFEEMRMTTHWPHKSILFGKKPHTYGKVILEITPIPRPQLSEVGRKLVGY